MEMRNFSPFLRKASACNLTRFSLGPIATAFHSLVLLSQLENPSWCSPTGPANRAPASTNICAHSSGSQAPPSDFSFGANCTSLPDLSFAPVRNLLYGQSLKG